MAEVGPAEMGRLWVRGGFPRSFLADTDADSAAWRKAFVRTFVERDLPQFGADLGAPVLHRFLAMLAHGHGQILNVAELSTALGVAQATVRRYLDLLEHLFLVRQLRPWHENLRKRQVKRPKVYLRDSGVYHHLVGVGTMDALQMHPRIGASWEGFVIEKVVAEAAPDEVWFWATHNGAELDLLLMTGGRRVGVEVKRVDAPRRTRSMAVALDDLRLDALYVVYPGDVRTLSTTGSRRCRRRRGSRRWRRAWPPPPDRPFGGGWSRRSRATARQRPPPRLAQRPRRLRPDLPRREFLQIDPRQTDQPVPGCSTAGPRPQPVHAPPTPSVARPVVAPDSARAWPRLDTMSRRLQSLDPSSRRTRASRSDAVAHSMIQSPARPSRSGSLTPVSAAASPSAAAASNFRAA